MLNLLIQFLLELARALLVDELSGRVRRRIKRWLEKRGGGTGAAVHTLQRRNRERLLNKLLTEIEDEL